MCSSKKGLLDCLFVKYIKLDYTITHKSGTDAICVFLVATRQIDVATHHVEGYAGKYRTSVQNTSNFPFLSHLHRDIIVSNHTVYILELEYYIYGIF
jgi:hypothetical protein